MTEVELQLQDALVTTFLANLAFLSEYDQELYHRVDELSRMIENGSYQEKYALEFIKEDGEFDIYDFKNEKYLYNKKPKKAIDKLVQDVQFDEKHAIGTLEDIFRKNKLPTIESDFRFNVEHLYESNFLTRKDMSAYTEVTSDYLTVKKKRLKEIKKFIFLGILTGRHVPRIANKVNAEIYLVCERNLEIFRLSLFTVDYTVLAQNKGVVFSVMNEPEEETLKIDTFIYNQPYDNYLIKFSSTGINIHEYIDRILTALVGMKPTSYDYNRYVYTFIKRATTLIKSNYPILQIERIRKKADFFNNKKVLFIAGGPSLNENIEWIQQNQDRFYIVTIGAAYQKLLDHNIHVDMISTLDEQYHVLNDIQFSQEFVDKIDENTIILASILTDKRILEKFKTQPVFIYEVFRSFFKDNVAMNGFSVGEVTLNLLLYMNVKDLYLVGLDMALNQDTGATHAEEKAERGNKTYNLTEEKNRDFFSLRDGLVSVKGNMIETVETTSLFYSSLRFVNLFLSKKNEDTKVYNLSRHGAYFNNTIPMNCNELDLNDIKSTTMEQVEIINCLKNCSKEQLDTTSKEYFLGQIDFLQKMLDCELKDFQNTSIKSYNHLLEEIMDITTPIIEKNYHNSTFGLIINNYLLFVEPYLNYHFNDVKLKKEVKKVEVIKNIFITQIKQLITDYINFLKLLN